MILSKSPSPVRGRGKLALLLALLLAAPAAARKKQEAPPPIPLAEQGLIDNVSGYTIDDHGTLDRFTGMLIEHYAGAFPLWLAPVQVRVMSISDKFEDYARQVEARFRTAGFRVGTDLRGTKINAKVRDAQVELMPYMLVVGGKDQENGTVSVRDRIDGDLGAMPIDEALAKLQLEVTERRIRQVSEKKFQQFDEASGEANEY